MQSSLTQLDKRVPVQNGLISSGVNFNNLLHGIYMIAQHTNYVNAPQCDWGVLVALNSNNGYSIQFAKSCIDDYDTPPLAETMNATFLSKISIVASYMEQEN